MDTHTRAPARLIATPTKMGYIQNEVGFSYVTQIKKTIFV